MGVTARLGGLAIGLALCLASGAHAQDAPFADVAPHIVEGVVRAAALGAPDPRIGRFDARRATAQSRARARALEALHRWADDALASVHATAREAAAVHAAIDARAEVVAVRPLVDAGAVVRVELQLRALRDACGREGLPW